MIRVLLLFFFIWLVYNFIRGFLVIRRAARSFSNATNQAQSQPEPEVKSSPKLISEDEGEYVDFEEVEPGRK